VRENCLYGRRLTPSHLSRRTRKGYSVWHGVSVPAVKAGGVCSSNKMAVMGAG
jgi:hypothetical protein